MWLPIVLFVLTTQSRGPNVDNLKNSRKGTSVGCLPHWRFAWTQVSPSAFTWLSYNGPWLHFLDAIAQTLQPHINPLLWNGTDLSGIEWPAAWENCCNLSCTGFLLFPPCVCFRTSSWFTPGVTISCCGGEPRCSVCLHQLLVLIDNTRTWA